MERKLNREYSNLGYKDIYLMIKSVYNLFIISATSICKIDKYENLAFIKKDKKINMVYYGGGTLEGYYTIIPDIIFKNFGSIIASYNVNRDNLLSLVEQKDEKIIKRLEVRTQFPDDMTISHIIDQNRGKILTFNNLFEVGSYISMLENEYYIINDNTDYDSISVYSLKNLGLVNTFEYINRKLVLT
ncbi:Hypothetical protein ORPV_98 [Orpheovirus IHUMI-LCC2]|uniref:Uncharacterized protein n=1 Tax=Orpheovirus IHUMI-LCC2 TaxID=2023057 RepID=A0A2I2L386_9VIRU|nr:Hypothetical protein ORPV_98 [Orpheovirus IHUMI-LCC2]SNW62002.1 Hypothetical protein ORPV_98 [Orpheovirus IHUMI-LCC2]